MRDRSGSSVGRHVLRPGNRRIRSQGWPNRTCHRLRISGCDGAPLSPASAFRWSNSARIEAHRRAYGRAACASGDQSPWASRNAVEPSRWAASRAYQCTVAPWRSRQAMHASVCAISAWFSEMRASISRIRLTCACIRPWHRRATAAPPRRTAASAVAGRQPCSGSQQAIALLDRQLNDRLVEFPSASRRSSSTSSVIMTDAAGLCRAVQVDLSTSSASRFRCP